MRINATLGRKFWSTASVVAISLPLLCSPANAQVDGDPASQDDGGIVVTAQFREQDLQEIPLAITAMDSAMIEARGYTRVSDITAQAPNVLLQPNPSGAGNSMRAFIRGVGQSDQSPSVEPGVGMYVDDIYFATITGSIFDLLDLDRVEVLRGPQGTLSGMNSVGGSVKLYSRKPSGNGGFVEATLGGLNRREFKASADLAIVPDQLFLRVSGMHRERDGYVKQLDYACSHPDDPYVVSGALKSQTSAANCQVGTLGDQSVSALRGSLLYDPGNGVEVNIIGDWTKDNSATQPTVLLRSGEVIPGVSLIYQGVPYDNRFVTHGEFAGDTVISDPFVNYANYYDPGVTYSPVDVAGTPGAANGPLVLKPANTLDAWGVSGKIKVELSDNLNIESITGYRAYSTIGTSDNDASPVHMLLNETNFDHEQFSQEIRLNGSLADDTVHFTIGGIYFEQSTVYVERVNAPIVAGIYGPPDKPTFHFLQQDEAEMKNKSGFAHVTWDATDQLSLAAGIRVTNEEKDYTFYRFSLDGSPFPILSDPANPLNGRTGSYKDTMVDYRANVSYRVNDSLMTYVQFATGFKGGGISPRPYFPQQIRGFGPEKLKSYEVGFKGDMFDRRLRLNAAAFYMDYVDYQATPDVCVGDDDKPLPLPYGTPGLCGQYLNVADATVKGFEVEAFAEPVDGLRIDGSLSYLDFKFKEPKIATSEVIEGSSRPGLGDWKWSAGIQYSVPFADGGSLTPRFDIAYISGYCGNLACTPIAQNDGYTLANGRLTYRSADADWSVALEVTNIFDKSYYINKFVSSYALGQPGRPREWAITVRRNF